MYEFTDKEIRKKFKTTAYGKKVSKFLYISLPFEIIACIVMILTYTGVISFKDSELNSLFSFLITWIFFLTAIIACYFDGKRDGAIEQYKIDNIKKK